MNLIYDHLSSLLLGVAIFFMLVLVQSRGTETSHDQAHYYSAKAHLLNIQEMIEHDFANIGAGVARYDPTFIAKGDSVFEFMALMDEDAAIPSKITYRWEHVETAEIDGQATPLYKVARYVDEELTGESASLMRDFDIELRNAQRQPVADFDDVEAVYVSFIIVSPLGGTDGLHEAHWNRTFLPPNLSNF